MLGLEEERRLCYVAITRAEKHLFLMDSEGESPQGIKKLCSRFLEEIGPQNYKRIGLISDDLAKESRDYIKRINRRIDAEAFEPLNKSVGDTVEHHVFGFGIIQGIDSKRGGYIVKFDSLSQPRNISKNYFAKNQGYKRIKSEYPTSFAYNKKTGTDNYDDNDAGVDSIGVDDIDDAGVDDIDVDDNDDSYADMSFDETYEDEAEREAKKVEKAIREARERAKKSPNLWKLDDVPHAGWNCVGIDDLGAPVGICELCGYQIIRYAHHMEHPKYQSLVCGCVCAGKMEGSVEEAKRRESEFKNMQARSKGLYKKQWRK